MKDCWLVATRVWGNLYGMLYGLTDTGVDVPHPRESASAGSKVPLNKHSTCLCALCADYHVGPFDVACITGVADFDYGLRVALVVEEIAAGHNDRIALPNQFRVGRDRKRTGNFVGAGVEEDNLVGCCGGIDSFLQTCSVVG